jgi:hypothetical protein
MPSRTVTSTQTQEEELRSRLRVQLERDGGNPSQLLELIMIATKQRVWEAFGMSFTQFIETPFNDGGLGWSIDNLKTVLTLRHRFEHERTGHKELVADLAEMRRQVTELLLPLKDRTGPQQGVTNNPQGIGGKSHKTFDNFDNYQNYQREPKPRQQSVGGGGTSELYTVRRLARDAPALHQKVMDGELSANAAAIEAGWRKAQQRFSLPNHPEEAGKYLAERVNTEWFMAMVDAYYRHQEGEE